jgi:hypothetical protein
MAEESLGGSADVTWQRHVTTLVLQTVGSAGFALAGSGAIREHGLTNRPTRDVDLFTTTATSPSAFAAAVNDAQDALTAQGYRVTPTRTTPEFARLLVEEAETGDDASDDASRARVVEVDFGIDWRNEPPTQLAIGPVIALRDAVGSKVAAVYSRGEARDFLDLDAIRGSGRFTDDELLALATQHDPGLELGHFIDQLRWVNRIAPGRTIGYGVDADQLGAIKTRLSTWADQLSAAGSSKPPVTSQRRPHTPRRAPTTERPMQPRPPDADGPSIGLG